MIRDYEKSEIIFREGALEPCMYEMIQGSVGLYADYGKPGEHLLEQLREENRPCFGEKGLIDELPRNTTAVALEATRVYVITKENFGSYFRNNPNSVLQMVQRMSQQIRDLTDDYLKACRTLVDASKDSGKQHTRLKKELTDLAGHYRGSLTKKA